MHDSKVLRSVVTSVVVDVVDVLMSLQSSSQDSRHDMTVFEHVFTIDPDKGVPVPSDESSLRFPIGVSLPLESPVWVAAFS